MNDDSVGWHDEFSIFSKTSEPSLILFELCGLGCCACKYLYVAVFELVCRYYLDRFSNCDAMSQGFHLLPGPGC